MSEPSAFHPPADEPSPAGQIITMMQSGQPDPNPLGIPSASDINHVAEQLRTIAGNRPPSSIAEQMQSDVAAFDAAWPGRWDAGFVPPRSIRPSDVLMLRTIATNLPMLSTPNQQPFHGENTLSRIVIDAPPFWVPGQIAWGLSRTDIPDDDPTIRLPFPTATVWFSEWPDLSEYAIAPQWAHALNDFPRAEVGGVNWIAPLPIEAFNTTVFTPDGSPEQGFPGEVRLAGACLLADPRGTPLDVVLWIVAVEHRGGVRDGGWSYLPIVARPSESALEQFWWSMCAIVSWGDWVDERPFDQVRNKGARRRLAGFDVGSVGPVRVLSAKHHPGRQRKTEPEGTHASPVAHPRRGHWRNQRYGKGRSESKRIWISPVIVNPDNAGSHQVTVWKLPPPESIPDTPTPDNPTGRWRRKT